MTRLIALAALAAALFAAPAQAQDKLMTALDFTVLREVVGELDFTINDNGVDEDGDYYLEVESYTGMLFYLYGANCSDSDPAVGCVGLNMVATFTLDAKADPHAVLDTISYAFMKTYRSGPDVKISRYVIFDNGISRGNMKSNVSIFAEIGDEVWEKLIDDDVLAN